MRADPCDWCLESPYAADTPEGIDANITYARACARDSLMRSEAPIASHLLHTQPGILGDKVPTDREIGIDAGLAWLQVAEATVVYTDRGISPGMQRGIQRVHQAGLWVDYRTLASTP